MKQRSLISLLMIVFVVAVLLMCLPVVAGEGGPRAVGAAKIPLDVIVNGAIAIISAISSWVLTLYKRKGKEIPKFAQPYIGTLVSYEDLHDAYKEAEALYDDSDKRRQAAIDRLQEIVRKRTGIALPDSVANLAVELAVSAAKSGWNMLRRKVN